MAPKSRLSKLEKMGERRRVPPGATHEVERSAYEALLIGGLIEFPG
jgi:hypothetical protein